MGPVSDLLVFPAGQTTNSHLSLRAIIPGPSRPAAWDGLLATDRLNELDQRQEQRQDDKTDDQAQHGDHYRFQQRHQ